MERIEGELVLGFIGSPDLPVEAVDLIRHGRRWAEVDQRIDMRKHGRRNIIFTAMDQKTTVGRHLVDDLVDNAGWDHHKVTATEGVGLFVDKVATATVCEKVDLIFLVIVCRRLRGGVAVYRLKHNPAFGQVGHRFPSLRAAFGKGGYIMTERIEVKPVP